MPLLTTKILSGLVYRGTSCSRNMSSVRSSSKGREPFLTLDNINPNLKSIESAIPDRLMMRANAIEMELKQGIKKPFKEVIRADAGAQTPITFIRQILALISYPKLFDNPQFPDDIKQCARTILTRGCRGNSIGSYTEAQGIELIRRHVADFIQQRDNGVPADWQDIVLRFGANDCIKNVLKLLICEVDSKRAGVLIPIPQCPLYSAILAEYNMHRIGYYLDELHGWRVDIGELQRAIDEARIVSNPRAIVVINPNNPTGHVLTRANIEDIIRFAYKERLLILADEVYQENIYAAKFYSFKRVLMEMGEPYCRMQLASFMSCSNGYLGEAGLRGGYAEVINLSPQVRAMFFKALSAMLCATVPGQVCLEALVNAPKEAEESYELFVKEKQAVLNSLKLKAEMVADAFNSFDGFCCNPIQGGMYAFPQIKLPRKAIEAAKIADLPPDEFYALQLLDATGICVVPGSGFGQQSGTYHLCITIRPQIDQLKEMLERFKEFHQYFMRQYSD